MTLPRASVIALAILLVAWGPWSRPMSPQAKSSWPLYDRYCLACHGEAGDGKGPAAPYTWARPRAFAGGEYAWRSTPVGQPPTDDDLRAAIRFAAPGTSMPAFDKILAPAQLDELIEVVKAFAPDGFGGRSTPVELAAPPAWDPDRGAELWTKLG